MAPDALFVGFVLGALFVLIYGGLLAWLVVSLGWGIRRQVRRMRVRRYLRQVHRQAYAERPGRAA